MHTEASPGTNPKEYVPFGQTGKKNITELSNYAADMHTISRLPTTNVGIILV
jgi:hypothetical protein